MILSSINNKKVFLIIVDLSIKGEFKANNYMKNSNSDNTGVATLALLNILLIYNILSITVLLVTFDAFLLVFLVVNVGEVSDKT